MQLKLVPILFAILIPVNAVAQESAGSYPSKPIRLVAPSLQGGLNDVVARVLSERLAASPEMNRQPVIVDNKGSVHIVAAQYTMNSPPDGYTILIADLSITAIIPVLSDKPPFDSLRDFTPVSLIGTTPFFLSVSSRVGVSNLREFVALVKANPGKLNYGSSGIGSVHHLATEALKTSLGLDVVHIPYKSSGQSTPALLGGEIDVLFTALGQVLPHIRAGKVRLLGVSSPERTPKAPDIPAFPELGVKDVLLVPSVHALAPTGTPRAIVAKLSAEIRRAAMHPDSLKRFEALGIDVEGSTPEQSLAQLQADRIFYTRAVKISGAKSVE
ncbi:MAG: tripartite tricarboxylate transporter substrate binding protein [Betaproteobacteria bacterium]|nr:tripartite tricarboxylate transporter substrate binding protein [Betaproteobacteria bacterium]